MESRCLRPRLLRQDERLPMKIGLIGGGNISNTHARAASAIPAVEVAAVYGSNLDKVNQLAQEYGAVPYHDLQAFLVHRPMELVIIGSPSGPPAQQGILAAQERLHAFVEKPFEVSSKQSAPLIAACEKARRNLGGIFQ